MKPPRVTIGVMMIAIFVVAIALAPISITLRTPRRELIVATAAFEMIMLPVIIALLVMARMDPGKARNRVVAALCLTPVFLAAVAAAAGFLWGTFDRVFVHHDYKLLYQALIQITLASAWGWLSRPRRCLSCGKFRPRRPLRMWPPSVADECPHCGRGAGQTRRTPGTSPLIDSPIEDPP